MADLAQVREAFREQARWCDRLGSPFTARLCRVLAETIDEDSAIGARVIGQAGDPMAGALALRLCGGLHALVRNGEAPELAKLYPPAPIPDEAAFARILPLALVEHAAVLDPWLDSPPQTNEVGRSGPLMSGLMVVADRFGLPMRLLELGASAGLNLQLDRYTYRLGGVAAGPPDSPVRVTPEWKGAPPPQGDVRIAARAGVDLQPLDPLEERERLLAYVWPDQQQRLAQLQNALDIDAGRVGRCHHVGLGFADDQAVVNRQPQTDVVHPRAGRQIAAEPVALHERFGVDQPRLDLPQAVLAQIAVAFDGAAMHQTARLLLRVT